MNLRGVQQLFKLSNDPFCGLPIPFRRNHPFLPLPGHQSRKRRWKLARIGPDQFVGADGDGFWAFGVVAEDRDIPSIAVSSSEVLFLCRLLTDSLSAFVREELIQVRPRVLWMSLDGGPELRAACLQR